MPNCAIYGCSSHNSNSKNENNGTSIRFYSFPKDVDLCEKWLKACKRKDAVNLKHARICSVHFSDDCFLVSLRSKLLNYVSTTNRNLKPDAIPTLRIPTDITVNVSPKKNARKRKRKENSDAKRNRKMFLNDEYETVSVSKETCDKNVIGDENVTCDKNVTGDENVTCDENVTGDENVTCNKNVMGDKNMTCNKNVMGDENVTCDENVTGDENVTCNKNVTGDENMTWDKNVTGDENVTGDKNVTGDEKVTCDKNVTGGKNIHTESDKLSEEIRETENMNKCTATDEQNYLTQLRDENLKLKEEVEYLRKLNRDYGLEKIDIYCKLQSLITDPNNLENVVTEILSTFSPAQRVVVHFKNKPINK